MKHFNIVKNKLFIFILSFCFFYPTTNVYSQVVSPDLLDSPAIQQREFFLPVLGRLTSTNDFIHRSPGSPARANLGCGITNMHASKGNVFSIDSELYNCSFRYEATLLDKFRFYLNVEAIRTEGGVFDSTIRHFHNMFSFPNGPRRQSNQDQFSAGGRLNNGDDFSINREDFGFMDPVLGVSLPLFDLKDKHFFFLDSSVSIPTGIYEYSLNKPELKLSAVYNYDASWGTLIVGFTGVSHFDRNQHGISYENYSFGGFSSASIPVTKKLALLLASSYHSGIVDNIESYPDHSWYIDTGVRFLVFEKTIIDLIIRENPSPTNATSDVSIFFQATF